MKVYFNNSCKICRAEIDLYKKQNIKDIEWVDITNNKLAEIETPDFVQGKSLVSNLKNPNKVSSEIAFSIWKNGETLISNKYYYTEWKRKGSVIDRMLYDIENDELQMNNIAEIRSNKSIVDSLSVILNKHIKSKK